jgi:hypothetical protein
MLKHVSNQVTTWRWGKVMAAMLLIGAVLKVTMSA